MILYKYVCAARGLDVLRRRLIRFTQPGDFNDPFEFAPLLNAMFDNDDERRATIERGIEQAIEEVRSKLGLPAEARGVLRALMDSAPGLKDQAAEMIRQAEQVACDIVPSVFHHSMNKSVGVLCLSERADSLLMWGHYADSHRGLVIGFDSAHPFFSKLRGPKDELGFLRRVEYRKVRSSSSLKTATAAEWFQTKSEEWAYEREWRILRAVADADETLHGPEPYPVHLFRFPSDAVKQVIVGLRATEDTVSQVRATISELPGARLLRARVHATEYGLLFSDF